MPLCEYCAEPNSPLASYCIRCGKGMASNPAQQNRQPTPHILKEKPSMNNMEKRKELTQKRNWSGIFELNGVKIDSFGTKKELSVLGDYLQKDEVVFALVSGVMSQSVTSNDFDFGANTWIAALTSERVLCLDHAMMSSSVDTQSIRLNRIQGVSASQGWIFGKVTIDIGARLIVIDNCEKSHVKIFADLANQLIRQKDDEAASPSVSNLSIADEISKLNDLYIKGVFTADEFSKAKAKLIDKL